MIIISATELKNNIFQYLDEVIKGETIVIQHNQKNAACLAPVSEPDWRNKMTIHPKLLVSPEKIIEPMDDIRED